MKDYYDPKDWKINRKNQTFCRGGNGLAQTFPIPQWRGTNKLYGLKTWFSAWYKSKEFRYKIQKTEGLKDQNILEKGKYGPAQSFPTQQCRSTNKFVCLKTWFSLWKWSFKIVKVQSKSNITERLKYKKKYQNIWRGKGWASLVFPQPHPQCRSTNKLFGI